MRTFIHLGLISSRRNLARSLITAWVMGMATFLALVLPASIKMQTVSSLTEAYHFLGGHVLAYRNKAWITAQDVSSTPAAEPWKVLSLNRDFGPPLSYFHPELFNGVAVTRDQSGWYEADLYRDLCHWAEDESDDVLRVNPYLALPVFRATWAGSSGVVQAYDLVLRGLNEGYQEEEAWYQMMAWGSFFTPRDKGKDVCLIDDSFFTYLRRFRLGSPPDRTEVPSAGGSIFLDVPSVWLDDLGHPHWDYTSCTTFELEVAGGVAVRGGDITWTVGPRSRLPVGRYLISPKDLPSDYLRYGEPINLAVPEIIVRPELFWDIYRLVWSQAPDSPEGAAGPERFIPASAVAFDLRSVQSVNPVLTQLRDRFPMLGIASTGMELAGARSSGMLGPYPEHAPRQIMPEYEQLSQPVVPLDISRPLTLLFIAGAAVVAASNGYSIALERQREMAILKALGARAFEVVAMVLSELAAITIAGGALGVVCGLVPMLAVALIERSTFSFIVQQVSTAGYIAGLVTGFALLAGLLPSLRCARSTTMEVFRQ